MREYKAGNKPAPRKAGGANASTSVPKQVAAVEDDDEVDEDEDDEDEDD